MKNRTPTCPSCNTHKLLPGHDVCGECERLANERAIAGLRNDELPKSTRPSFGRRAAALRAAAGNPKPRKFGGVIPPVPPAGNASPTTLESKVNEAPTAGATAEPHLADLLPAGHGHGVDPSGNIRPARRGRA